jgi:O-antigen/teichoic acid export membrane protein
MNSVGALIAFSVVLFPIFSRLKGNRLKKAVKKSRNITIIISLGAFVATLIFSNLAINIVYGSQYSPAVLILRLISLILFIDPLIAIYSNYFISQGKNTTVAKLVLIATLINIVLNYILITLLVPFSMYAASLGAASATILSRGFYLFLLLIRK